MNKTLIKEMGEESPILLYCFRGKASRKKERGYRLVLLFANFKIESVEIQK